MTLPRRVYAFALAVMLVAACERASQRLHTFVPADIQVTPTVHVSVRAYGNWATVGRGDSVIYLQGSPYVIEVRVYGAGRDVELGELFLTDSMSGTEQRIADWQTRAMDPGDSSVVFAHRTGVQLHAVTHGVRGTVNRGSGSDTSWYRFEGTLAYRFEERSVNAMLERLRGL